MNAIAQELNNIEKSQDDLTKLAQAISEVLGVQYQPEARVTSATIRISNDGSVVATCNLRVSKYFRTRPTFQRD